MAGTKAGGLLAAKRNMEREPDFYKRIGQKGGSRQVPKGFATNLERARTAGAKGGAISRRKKLTEVSL
jgi:general stress protein YciG